MKHSCLLLPAAFAVVLFLSPSRIPAQQSAPEIQWQRCYGGSGDDEATSIQQTSDGGYVVAGFSNSNDGDITNNHGGYDYWILKIDANGTNNGKHRWEEVIMMAFLISVEWQME